jgi:uncharacterized protein YgiM (DUF1202 family)
MKRIILLTIILALTACAPRIITDTPPPVLPATDTPGLPPPTPTSIAVTDTVPPSQITSTAVVLPPVVVTATSLPPVTGVFNPYAVVLVFPNDVLNIRSGAGVGNAVVGTLQPTASGVNRTGPAATAGGDRWVEIQNPRGGIGWVNSNFLTEHVTSSMFCADARVSDLLGKLKTALLNSNGEQLAALVSPAHGLDLRLWRYGTVANYTPEEAAWAFQSDYEVSWGPAPGSGDETRGTFRAQPLPKLQEVFGGNYTLHCNDTLDLATFSLEPWPPEYANINFYTVYKPGTEQYGGLDWRAWTAGVEYVQGKPTLFALIHYQWEP